MRKSKMSACRNESFILKRPLSLGLFVTVHPGTHFLDVVGCDVFVVFHHLVDDTVRGQLDDAVGHRLDEFMVV